MATKLKDATLTSVDFVDRGANQDAHFKLLKRQEEQPPKNKSAWELFKAFLKGKSAYSDEELKKSWQKQAQEVMQQERNLYTETLDKSMERILSDAELGLEEKYSMMQKSLTEFHSTMQASIEGWHNLIRPTEKEGAETMLKGEQKEGGEDMNIDKSKLTAEELAQYEALVKKAGTTQPEDNKPIEKKSESKEQDPPAKEPKEGEEPEVGKKSSKDKNVCKSEEQKVEKAFEQEFNDLKQNMANLQKSHDMESMLQVAKKYTLLGKKEEELADTLYAMKKSGAETYDQYIALLDENLALVEKSGLFSEIGKSGNTGAYVGSNPESKIQAAAAELRKSNPDLSQYDAIEKAWEAHPELAEEYEKSYRERR